MNQGHSYIPYSGKFLREKISSKVLKLEISQKKCFFQHAPIEWQYSDKTVEMKHVDKYDRRHYGTMMP